MMSKPSIFFYFVRENTLYQGKQYVYQATPVNGKFIPRNFVYLVHDNKPCILVENRDRLTPVSYDESGFIVQEKLSNIYYKAANFSKAIPTDKEIKVDKHGNPILFLSFFKKTKDIYPGHKFHFDPATNTFIVEPFDESINEIYYFNTNARSIEWHEAVKAGITLN